MTETEARVSAYMCETHGPYGPSRFCCACTREKAFPDMLRAFLYTDDARDITGKWGFTSTMGDQFREELIEAAGVPEGAQESASSS